MLYCNNFQNQRQTWKINPQNQQRTWAPAPQTLQHTYAPIQNNQQQSWANRAQQYRPPNKHQPTWDPWVRNPQTLSNKETDTIHNIKPAGKIDNVLKAVAPRNHSPLQQEFQRKRIPQAPVNQSQTAPAPNYTPNTNIPQETPYNTVQATFNPKYQTINQTKNLNTAPLPQAAGSDWSSQSRINQIAHDLQEAIQAINVLSNQFKSFVAL